MNRRSSGFVLPLYQGTDIERRQHYTYFFLDLKMMKNKEEILKLAEIVDKGKVITLKKHKKALLKYNYSISKFIVVPTDTNKEIKSVKYIESAFDIFLKLTTT